MKQLLLAVGILVCITGSVVVEARERLAIAQQQATQLHKKAERTLVKAIKAYCKTDRLHPVCSVKLNEVESEVMLAYLSDFDQGDELRQVYQTFLEPIPCGTDTDCDERNPWLVNTPMW